MGFPLVDVLNLGTKIIDRVLPDKEKAAEAKLKLLELQQNGELAVLTAETDLAKGQQDINKVEAANASIFVSGWRPFIGWTCGGGLAYQFILRPLLIWVSGMFEFVPPPSLEMDTLVTLLLGMLGLGSLRTAEKIKGVAK